MFASTGQYGRAVENYDRAIQLNPQDGVAFYNRGLSRFYQGQFVAAAQDLAQAEQLTPPDLYRVLQLYLAQIRAGLANRDEFPAKTSRFNLQQWPGPIVSMFLSGMIPQAVLDVAPDSNAEARRGKPCEAYFYVGQYLLIQGRRSEAISMFQRAVATGLTGFIEYNAAKAELARLGESIRK